jgi:hypothetical protein
MVSGALVIASAPPFGAEANPSLRSATSKLLAVRFRDNCVNRCMQWACLACQGGISIWE